MIKSCSRDFRGVARGRLAAVMLAFCAGVQALGAAIPEAARADPRFRLGYLVVTHYEGVRADGGGDSTRGLQQAIDDAYAANLVCLLPLGTYRISDTLKCVQWHPLKADGVSLESNPFKTAAFQIAGEHGADGRRPQIRLVPTGATAAQFGDAARPRPMLLLRLYESLRAPNPPRTEPADVMGAPEGWRIDTSYLFDCRLRNLDFDCGGYAGAIGVVWPAAQGASVESVRVDARGAHAGFYGLPGRNWGGIDLEVTGGEYGIRHGYGAGQAANREVCAGVTLVGVRLAGQTRRAIDYVDFVPLVMIGFSIEKDFSLPGVAPVSPVALVESTSTANNTLVLLDGRIELRHAPPGLPGIANPGNGSTAGKTVYLRNVYVSGTTRPVQSTAGAGIGAEASSGWHRIDEYAYTDPRGSGGPFPAGTTHRSFVTATLVDGSPRAASEPVSRSAADLTGPPDDLLARHLPAGGFPYYEGAGSPPAAVVTDGQYGAVAGSGVDAATAASNTAAIQAAIDAAAADERLGGRVFVPKGVFRITGTLTLKANTRLFGAGKTNLAVLAAHASWQPTTAPGVLVRTVDDPAATCYLGSVDLQVPDRNLYENPFTFFHWRAGAGSMTHDLRGSCGLWLTRPRFDPARIVPFVCVRFDGAAGGRHYFAGNYEQQFTSSSTPIDRPGYRSVVIAGTDQPLWFYGFNNEGGKTDRRSTDVEITGASGVVMLGVKREGGAPMVTVRDSRRIVLLGGGAMREPARERTANPAAAYVAVEGVCSEMLVGGILIQQIAGGAGGRTLEETAADGAAIAYPLGVGVFKRGEIDWEGLRPGVVRSSGGDPGSHAGRLLNVSARLRLDAGQEPGVAGFVLAGEGARTLLLRAVGPALAAFGIAQPVPNPTLRLYRDQALLAENDDWGSTGEALVEAFAAAGAFPLPFGGRDAAILATLAPGAYTVHGADRAGDGGTLLLEVFDRGGAPGARVVNLSVLARGRADGENPIVGVVVGPGGAAELLLRAVGPSLAAFGVGDAMGDPAFRVYAGGRAIDGNDDWGSRREEALDAAGRMGAFPLVDGSRDAVVRMVREAGACTLNLVGGSGRILTEIYARRP
jgi:hypothetical protein